MARAAKTGEVKEASQEARTTKALQKEPVVLQKVNPSAGDSITPADAGTGVASSHTHVHFASTRTTVLISARENQKHQTQQEASLD